MWKSTPKWCSLQSASAHADANQLLAWLRTMPEPPDQVYVVHGECGPGRHLRKRIKHELGLARHGAGARLDLAYIMLGSEHVATRVV